MEGLANMAPAGSMGAGQGQGRGHPGRVGGKGGEEEPGLRGQGGGKQQLSGGSDASAGSREDLGEQALRVEGVHGQLHEWIMGNVI